MSIETVKEQARRHEQKEEWQKSLDLYLKAIGLLGEDDPPDIGLHNRVGDLFIRLDNLDAAVNHYELAIDMYVEAELPNNAIAICKKILRNLASRESVYLKMGQIRGAQGFLPDARQNFLMYAEIKMQAGEVDEAFRALVEFADLAPEDTATRVALADQLLAHERATDAVVQLIFVHRKLNEQGHHGDAEELSGRILDMDPDADLSAIAPPAEVGVEAGTEADGSMVGFESSALAGFDEPAVAQGPEIEAGLSSLEITQAAEAAEDAAEEAAGDEHADQEAFEISTEAEQVADEELELDEPEEDHTPLPTFDFDEESAPLETAEHDEPEEDHTPLPTFDFDEESAPLEKVVHDEPEEDDTPLPTLAFDEESEPPEGEEALPTFGVEGESDDAATEVEAVAEPVEDAMEDVAADDWKPLSDDELAEQPEDPLESGPAWSGAAVDGALPGEDDESGDLVDGLREQLERAPDDAEAWLALGQALLGRNEATEATAALERAHKAFASADDLPRAMQVVRELILQDREEIEHHQRLVEYAFQSNDRTLLLPAYLELAECLNRNGEPVRSQAVYQQALNIDPTSRRALDGLGRLQEGAPAQPAQPVASSSDYVDLGSLILDDDTEKTTRWTVTAEAPSGDEDADFAKMLAQFKEKVSENLESDDVKAHYDLGTAYMEMGLVDEAIAEFQQALRADPGHLASYELMGQCFLNAGQHDAAVRSLSRALEAPYEIEDELLGIYYYLGRAHEAEGANDLAKDFYEKVFALDINFIDVTDRLRELR